jgi:hypothetical protein
MKMANLLATPEDVKKWAASHDLQGWLDEEEDATIRSRPNSTTRLEN